VLLLIGVTALLPWLVEAVVARLNSGSVSWQLAVRRLQLSSGSAARMVNGIAVAVAGAIALQMLFAGIESDYTRRTGSDLSRAQLVVRVPSGSSLSSAGRSLDATEGVRKAATVSLGEAGNKANQPDTSLEVAVGGCASLREVAHLPSCRDGDVFQILGGAYDGRTKQLTGAGRTLYLDPGYPGTKSHPVAWKVPATLKSAGRREDPTGYERGGLLFTPRALPEGAEAGLSRQVYVSLDERVPDAADRARNAAARLGPLAQVSSLTSTEQSKQFRSVRTGLFVGASCVLVQIGASLLVSQMEQLRERKKLLSSLVAFGTRRRTLSLSVLWQTAIPIALGLLLASVVGLTLGVVLLKMTGTTVSVDWASVLSMTGIGAAVVLAVTVLSLPPLLRLMRPDGLRTE
jgi:hypothetical protein